jgi:hypothetical protein
MNFFSLLGRGGEGGLQYAIETGPLSNNYDAFSHWKYKGNVFFFFFYLYHSLSFSSDGLEWNGKFYGIYNPQSSSANSSKISCPQQH